MKIREMKKGQKVEDRWYWDWGIGIVQVVKKTVVYVKFCHAIGVIKYDAGHTQFLKEVYEKGVAAGRKQVLTENIIRTEKQIQEVQNGTV